MNFHRCGWVCACCHVRTIVSSGRCECSCEFGLNFEFVIFYSIIGVPKLVRGEVWNLLMVQQQMFHQVARQKKTFPNFYSAPYEDMLKELTSQQHAILIDLGEHNLGSSISY